MRIAWVKVGGLWPLDTGGRLRTFHLVSELSRRHPVTLLTTHGPADDVNGLRQNLPDLAKLLSVPFAAPKRGTLRFAKALVRSWMSSMPVDLRRWKVPALREELHRIAVRGEVDLVVADFLSAIPSLPSTLGVPVVLFEHNVEYVIWQRLRHEAPLWQRPLIEVEWRKLRRYERDACRGVRSVFAVSDVDREALRSLSGVSRVETIPTGVDVEAFSPRENSERPQHLVFTGSMDWYPNEDAILHFARDIWPIIRRDLPRASLSVVGRNPGPRIRALNGNDGVHVSGTVPDVRPFIAESAVYVVPLRIGGGTRLKIFEALAMGKAVVSTTIGAEGLPLVDGTHYVRADTIHEFAVAVRDLLADSERRRRLGTAGRSLVEHKYSWTSVSGDFVSRCLEVMNDGAA